MLQVAASLGERRGGLKRTLLFVIIVFSGCISDIVKRVFLAFPCTCCRWPVWRGGLGGVALHGPSLPGLPDSCHSLHRRHGDKWLAGWMVSGKVGQSFLPLWSTWCYSVNRPRPKRSPAVKTIYGLGLTETIETMEDPKRAHWVATDSQDQHFVAAKSHHVYWYPWG